MKDLDRRFILDSQSLILDQRESYQDLREIGFDEETGEWIVRPSVIKAVFPQKLNRTSAGEKTVIWLIPAASEEEVNISCKRMHQHDSCMYGSEVLCVFHTLIRAAQILPALPHASSSRECSCLLNGTLKWACVYLKKKLPHKALHACAIMILNCSCVEGFEA